MSFTSKLDGTVVSYRTGVQKLDCKLIVVQL